MGLTRIRAEQISDIDYKQAVRVITLSNITLSGGAPAEVDGVSLVAGDRVLVNGQSNAAQNGLYQVQTVGAGSNGTWVRTSDANQDGEIQPGMVVMVTQGAEYADTPWKLITNGVIEIGVTELTFEENYSLAFGNIFANGTAVVANAVSAPITFTAGDNIAIIGNNTAKSVTFAVTGISLNSISNGTSNVTVVSSGGNVTVGVAGSEVAEFSSVGLDITGNITGSNISTIGNISGNYILGNGSQLTGLPATYGNVDVADFLANGFGSNTIITTGNITSGNILGNGAGLSGINVFSNVTIDGGNSILADSISDTLTLIAGDGISLTGNAAADSITIALTGSGESIFVTGGDMGTVEEAVTQQQDLGAVDEAVTTEINMGTIVTSGVIYPDQLVLPSFTVAELGNLSATPAAQMVFCTNETGGAVPAFSDGTNWRRVTDRAIVT